MFRFSVLTIFGLFLSLSAHAAEVDLTQSSIQWTGSKVTGSSHTGKVIPKSIKVVATDGVIKSAEVVMDLKTFTVTDITGKSAQRFLKHMKSDDFFDVETFPTASLSLTSVQDGIARGQLTIKDKTHPVIFKIQQTKNVYTGQLKFDRTKFGMIYGSGSFFKNLGDKVIKDEVVVDFSIVLKGGSKSASL